MRTNNSLTRNSPPPHSLRQPADISVRARKRRSDFFGRRRRVPALMSVVVATALLASCKGFTTAATHIVKHSNGSYSAQLNFVGSCGSGEHCSWYAHYRMVGTQAWTKVPATPLGPVAGPVSNTALSENATGLTAGAQYEYQVCGNAQPGQQFVCVGPDGTPNTTTKFTTAAWKLQITPTTSGYSILSGVSCTTPTACTAVGVGTAGALAERWDGSNWTMQATPKPSSAVGSASLSGVSCASAIACTAVGTYDSSTEFSYVPLAMGWDGTSWTIQSVVDPSTGALNAVSCSSGTACTALVIGFNEALADRWNGSSWTLETPDLGGLLAVSCSSATACTAVGQYAPGYFYETVAEAWDGSNWTVQTTPDPSNINSGGINGLFGVSCTSATACTAVGSYNNSAGTSVTLAERWNGSTWSVQATPNPSGAKSTSLSAVSCTSATACTAVGSYNNSAGTQFALAEHWDGSTWSIQATPTPSGATSSSLSAVSCTSATTCTAVGTYTNSTGTQLALAERYAG
jgi:hypothetical protein